MWIRWIRWKYQNDKNLPKTASFIDFLATTWEYFTNYDKTCRIRQVLEHFKQNLLFSASLEFCRFWQPTLLLGGPHLLPWHGDLNWRPRHQASPVFKSTILLLERFVLTVWPHTPLTKILQEFEDYTRRGTGDTTPFPIRKESPI